MYLHIYLYLICRYYTYKNVLTWTSPQPRWSSRSVRPAMPSWWMLCTPDDFQKSPFGDGDEFSDAIGYRSPSVPLSGSKLRNVCVRRPVHDNNNSYTIYIYKTTVDRFTAIGIRAFLFNFMYYIKWLYRNNLGIYYNA